MITGENARLLAERGYHVVPLIPATKAAVDKGWQNLRMSVTDVETRWDDNPKLNVGLLLGTEVERGVFLIAVDIDVNDPDLIRQIRYALPGPAPAKRGAKGITFIARTAHPIRKVLIKRTDKNVGPAAVEILAAGQQTVLPPSIHPSGVPYEWEGRPLTDFAPAELPLVDPNTLNEIKLAVKHPEAKFFLLNSMRPPVQGEAGNYHESCVLAVASAVAHGFPDGWITDRVLRAMRDRDLEFGSGERDWDKEKSNIAEWLQSAKSKEFDKKGQRKEAVDVTLARWLRDDWPGDGAIYSRSGQVLVYERGAYRAYSPDAFYKTLAACGNTDLEGLGHRGWQLVTNTLLAMLKEFPDVVPHRRVCLTNGTYDLDAGELRAWDKADFLISRLNFDYNADVASPRYDQFLAETFDMPGDGETDLAIACFEEYLAMSLFECHDFQRFLVLEGTTRSGKSVLARVARLMHSPDAVASVMAHDFGKESSRTSMLGKLINITGETSTVNTVADDYLKQIVAGEAVDVRHLYHGGFSAVLPTRILIATNDPLRTKDTSGAVMERMLVLRCDNYVPPERRDPKLADKLRWERAGIFNRVARAWPKLRDRGSFAVPESTTRTAEQFQIDNNLVMLWLMERTHQGRVFSDPEYNVPDNVTPVTPINQLYLDYTEWSRTMGFMQMTVITFGMKLAQIKVRGKELTTKTQHVKGGSPIRVREVSLIAQPKY